MNRIRKTFRSQCQLVETLLSKCTTETEFEQDWLEKWRRDSKPFTIGKHFLINPCPSTKILEITKRFLICFSRYCLKVPREAQNGINAHH